MVVIVSFDLDRFMLRKRHRLLLREVKRQDAVLKLGLDVFFIDILADVEASGHGTGITLLMDDLAFLVLALFFNALGRGDRQIPVLQLQINLIFLEARQVYFSS